MKLQTGIGMVAAVLLIGSPRLWAEGEGISGLEDLADLDRQLNQVGAERAELFTHVKEQRERVSELWRDPAFTSGEIEALRKRLQALELELLEVKDAIRRKVSELPEVKPLLKRLETDSKRLEALTQRRTELLEQRARLYKP